ncbi:MAG: FkbM family methyltransferase [Oscillatoriales cyanobacterium C42_A2020_001]|nr:FkbM family methyltransferase [Leptolyngbyaceae cyanobacterium C42_A2020_001]
MIVVDVGAHDGRLFAVPQAQDINNAVYAIEPIPELAEQLRAHRLSNLHVFCCAMGDEEGNRTFHVNQNDATSSLLIAHCNESWQAYADRLQEVRSLQVPVVRLDSFLDQQSLAEVDLLKIDAQGYDLQVLQGAGDAIHRIKRIIVEVQLTPLYQGSASKEEIVAYLVDRGFRLAGAISQTEGLEENLEFVRVTRYPRPHPQTESFEVNVPYIGIFQTPKADHVGQLLEEGTFEGLEQAFLWLYLRPGDTFFDCGAHAGLLSCIAAKRLNNIGGIVGFEPNPVCFDLYQKNLQALGCTCFKALDVGLSNTNGMAELLLGKPGMSAFSTFAQNASTMTQINGEAVIGSDRVMVSQRSLDTLLPELHIESVTLAKLDVEGWEIAVLKGAEQSIRAGKFPLWMIEFTEANAAAAGTSTRELRTLLENFGYTLCRFDATNFRLLPEPAHRAYPYINLFAVMDLDAVNQRLATADLAVTKIAQDVVQRWETAATGAEMRQNFLREKQHSEELHQQVELYSAALAKERELSHELRQWAEASDSMLAKERQASEMLRQTSQQLQQNLQTQQQQFQELQQRFQALRQQFLELQQHLLASRWLKLGRKLGLTKLDGVFPHLLNDAVISASVPTIPAVEVPPQEPITQANTPPGFSMELTLQHLFQKGFQPEIVLDLGAAKGYWSEYAQSFFPRATFYMVDPLQESEAHLKQLCEGSDRFHYLLCAVGDRNDQLLMNVTTDLDGSSLLSFNRPPEPQDRVVDIRRVDDLMAEGKLKPPQLVKMDLQGYELKALEGGQRLFETAEVFILETSLFEFMPDQPLVHEVMAYMAERNYVVFDIAGHLRRPYENDLGQVDFVFVKRDSSLRASNRWS